MEPKKGIIYRYVFDDGMMYVGQTTYPVEKRHKEHLRGTVQYVDRKLKQHEYKLEVLCEAPAEELDRLEIEYIKQFDCIFPKGCNLSGGGKTMVMTPEIKEKISKSNMGKPKSQKARENMSKAKMGKEPWNKGIKTNVEPWNKGKRVYRLADGTTGVHDEGEEHIFVMTEAQKKHLKDLHESMKGVPKSEETRKKISEKLKGVKLPEETCRKMSESRMGHKTTPEQIEKTKQTRISRGLNRRIINLDTGEIFESLNDAKRKYNHGVSSVVRGITKTCCGYRFAYYDEVEKK